MLLLPPVFIMKWVWTISSSHRLPLLLGIGAKVREGLFVCGEAPEPAVIGPVISICDGFHRPSRQALRMPAVDLKSKPWLSRSAPTRLTTPVLLRRRHDHEAADVPIRIRPALRGEVKVVHVVRIAAPVSMSGCAR